MHILRVETRLKVSIQETEFCLWDDHNDIISCSVLQEPVISPPSIAKEALVDISTAVKVHMNFARLRVARVRVVDIPILS